MGMESDWHSFLSSLEGDENSVVVIEEVVLQGDSHVLYVFVHRKPPRLYEMPDEMRYTVFFDEEHRSVSMDFTLHLGIPMDRIDDVRAAVKAHPREEPWNFCVLPGEGGIMLGIGIVIVLPELVEDELCSFTRDEILQTCFVLYAAWSRMHREIHEHLGIECIRSPATLH
ncbi:MAG: hypothetical protein A2854_01345 [Parcubacteria group bacterium RIFCSPHIGHO2_01_FULL_56_18]|nr:MAG: hypothetical protein A2854_01345 [Parcubacteria group bacterium RIFCSPHIGHO2_01_FULL_56_18]